MSFTHQIPSDIPILRVRKAIKTHICSICKKEIQVDEHYVVSTILLAGYSFISAKTCKKHTRLNIKETIKNVMVITLPA